MTNLRKALTLLILGMLGILVQGTFLKYGFSPNWIVPNFLLIFVVYLSFYEATPFGAVLSFLLGIEFDLASGELLGPHAASMAVVFGFLSSVTQRIFVDSVLAVFLAVFLSSMFAHLIYVILLFEFKPSQSLLSLLVEFSLPEALLTALVAPVMFSILRRLLLQRAGEQVAYS